MTQVPFWNNDIYQLSTQIFLPTSNTIPFGVDCNSWNGVSAVTLRNSWFSVHMRSYQGGSLTVATPKNTSSTPPKPTSKKQKKAPQPDLPDIYAKPAAAKAVKIRVYPTKEQTQKLKQWFGTARWTYNRCVDVINKDQKMLNRKFLRNSIVNNANYAKDNQWALETPYEVRDGAMLDVIKAYDSNFAKSKKNPAHRFKLKFRSRKDQTESIFIRGRSFKKGVFYTKYFGKEPIRSGQLIPDSIEYDCRLLRTRLNKYYICIPKPLEVASDNQARLQNRVIALDPGVRTFQTGYDPSGTILEFGRNDGGRIARLCWHMDKLHSKSETKGLSRRKRYRMRRAFMRARLRLRNLVDECHKKVVLFLVRNYSLILLPSFETSQMVSRIKRRIRSKTARAMLTWAHYRFKQRLLDKTREYPWCKVEIVDESYTSKTCGKCGWIHQKLGGSKIYKCGSCGIEIDRDINGARNILLKNTSLFDLAVE
jgi:putative transposase